MLDTILKYILGEFRMIADAPVSFVTAVLAVFVIVWAAMTWRYGGVIDNKDSEIGTLKSENSRLRVALNVDPATPNSLLQLNNKELTTIGRNVVGRLRNIDAIVTKRTAEINVLPGLDEKEKRQRIDAMLVTMDKDFVDMRAETFNVDFELRRRLGPVGAGGILGVGPYVVATDGTRISLLQLLPGTAAPAFHLGFISVLADGIEQMAKLLPPD